MSALPRLSAAVSTSGLTGTSIDVDGTRVHYVDAGDGAPLVFVHGGPAWSFTWRDVIARLADRFRCIAIDLPGFGRSPALAGDVSLRQYANLVRRFVERLDLDRVTLVANDTGGPIGFRAASLAPERYARFVAVDTFAFALDEFPMVRLFLRLFSSPPARFVNRRLNLLPRAVTSFGTPRHRWTEAERAAYLEPFASAAMRDRCIGLLRALVREPGYLDELDRGVRVLTDRPLLTIFGSEDPVRRYGFPEKFAAMFPRSTHRIVTGAKHFAHEDDPDGVATFIRDWLSDQR